MGAPDFDGRGERRRVKAAATLVTLYGWVWWMHHSLLGAKFALAMTLVFGVHALRLVVAAVRSPAPNLESPLDLPVEWPAVSLVAAAKNEEAVIGRLVESLCQLDYAGPVEVWIVDDHSTDRTAQVLEKYRQVYPQLRVLRRGAEAQGGKSGALNQVLPLTTGAIVGVFDADAQVARDILPQVLAHFQDEEVGAVQLRKAIANHVTNFWTKGQAAEMALDMWFQEQRVRVGGLGELRGNGQFVRRSALLECGGWNEQTITDDLDLTLRLHLQGWDIACVFFPAVQEEGVVTIRQLWHQRNRWAEGGYQRYLDYWRLIVQNRAGIAKTFDLACFAIVQYGLPAVAVPDLAIALVLGKGPVLTPLLGLSLLLSTIGMFWGIRRAYGVSPWAALGQTLRGTIYMLHWLPTIATMTVRVSLRPKRLKWVKTVHQGGGTALALDDEEE
ncbi:MAG: glycosyltransferase family 2 protein [Oscillatoriales cyanobacterium SM2_1_8]|nr:glycosyltransferase family 2 protein [Oscillatoriales cyanobacterium SM2_1_8]